MATWKENSMKDSLRIRSNHALLGPVRWRSATTIALSWSSVFTYTLQKPKHKIMFCGEIAHKTSLNKLSNHILLREETIWPCVSSWSLFDNMIQPYNSPWQSNLTNIFFMKAFLKKWSDHIFLHENQKIIHEETIWQYISSWGKSWRKNLGI